MSCESHMWPTNHLIISSARHVSFPFEICVQRLWEKVQIPNFKLIHLLTSLWRHYICWIFAWPSVFGVTINNASKKIKICNQLLEGVIMKSRFVEYLRKSRQKGDNKNVTKNSQIKNAFLANLRNSMPNQSCSPIIKCLKQPAVLTIYNEQWNECSHSDKSNIHGKVECYIWLSIVNHQQHSLDVWLLKDKKTLGLGPEGYLWIAEKKWGKMLDFQKETF